MSEQCRVRLTAGRDKSQGSVIGIEDVITRDQPNSRDKMRDFTVEFLKCAKFHGKFTEGV